MQAHEDDPTNVEWALILAIILRMKRREQPNRMKKKKATPEEEELVELLSKLEPGNPFIRLNRIECVIDAVREQNGRFQCGDLENAINLRDTDEAMRFLKSECK